MSAFPLSEELQEFVGGFPQEMEVLSNESRFIDNGTLQDMRRSGQLPPVSVQRQYRDDIERIQQGAAAHGLAPEVALRILRARGITPEQIKKDLEFRTLLDQRAQYEHTRRLADLERRAKTANVVAESFQDPNAIWATTGLPGSPYSPQRATADRTTKPEVSKWDKEEDSEGRLWYVDRTGQQPPRRIQIPGEDGQQTQLTKRRDLASNELESLRDNSAQLVSAMRALGLSQGEMIEGQRGDKEATGWKGFLWDPLLQRIDPEGVATRSAIGNIGSLKIKQRSGGAVPAAEFERLKPFVPSEKDDQYTVQVKLKQFINEYTKMLEEDVAAFEQANRRIPVALKARVQQMVELARQAQGGRLPVADALERSIAPPQQGGQVPPTDRPNPQQLIQMWIEQQRGRK